MHTDPTRCELKIPHPSGAGFTQCHRRWAEAVEVADVTVGARRRRRFCRHHAQDAYQTNGHGLLLVRRPAPLYRYAFRLALTIVIDGARSDADARRSLTRLLQPLARVADADESGVEPIRLVAEPEVQNGDLLAAWDCGIAAGDD